MKYKYLHQTKDNENREGWVVAKNRAEAYAALRKQGIRPYRVIGDDPPKWRSWAAGLALAAFAAFFAAAVWWTMSPAGERESPARRQQLTGDRAVISAGLESGWEGVFSTTLDRFLAAYAQPGWIALPPDVTEDDISRFADELETKLDFSEGEPPEVRQLKRIVLEMRREMKNYLASGGTAGEYMSFLEERQDEELSFRQKALKSVESAPESSRERIRMNMNVRLHEMGLPELGR